MYEKILELEECFYEFESYLMTFSDAFKYCYDEGKDASHIICLVEIIERQMEKIKNSIANI